MLKIFFIAIILYIIIQQIVDSSDECKNNLDNNDIIINQSNYDKITDKITDKIIPTHKLYKKIISNNLDNNLANNLDNDLDNDLDNKITTKLDTNIVSKKNIQKVINFDRPNPWNKIIFNEMDEYPYYYHIKIKIPSLNDYEKWKQIIPNIDFDPNNGELIIPSKDEPSALAIANLIIINFSGQLSLKDILEKNLIQISVSKAKTHELVKNKFKDQIMENLYGKSYTKIQTNYEKDLAKNNINNDRLESKDDMINTLNNKLEIVKNNDIDFKDEKFTDTFEYFNNKADTNINGPDAYDGLDYTYL